MKGIRLFRTNAARWACTIFSGILLVACGGGGSSSSSSGSGPVKIAWSVWTGWMPFKLIDKEGLLEKRAKELGVNVELVEFKGYMESVQAFSAGQVDACAMTSMEALQPASTGVQTVAVLVNDISNGGDGVLVRTGMTVDDLKGKDILLEQFSVSHYVLSRLLERHGIADNEVTIKNTPGDDAGKAFLADDTVQAVATWNPHLFLAKESNKGEILFDSSSIPGEIIDLLVFNGKTLASDPKVAEAIVLAWYDAMALITGADTRDAAIKTMAEGAGAEVEEFERMLEGTILYTDAAKGVELFKSPDLPETMNRIRDFSFKNELITDKDFEIGYGADSSSLMRFNPTFMEGVAGN
jgi:NitT/TauT family transport system substrate-binding protein